jgi:hypothetical protein
MIECKKHGYWYQTSNPYYECPKCSAERQIKECKIEIKKQNRYIKNLKQTLK